MTVEQVVMRQMKVSGGLTRGHGMTDEGITQWVASLPACAELTNEFEEVCGVSFISGKQHIEVRESGMARDMHAFKQLVTYL